MKKIMISLITLIVVIIMSASVLAQYCSNGIIEGLEECDNGEQNSDSQPNACRTTCVSAYCGDGVIDNGEECDDGEYGNDYSNSDLIPGNCRSDCTLPSCGDGVIDYQLGEECDDGLSWPPCHNCLRCYTPEDNLHISESGQLCPGYYEIADEGEEGVIIIDGYNVVLDCNGAQLEAPEAGIVQAQTQTQAGQQQMQSQIGGEDEEEDTGFVAQFFGFFVNLFGGNEGNGGAVTGSPTYVHRVGTGIYVQGDNAVLVGCDVTNYKQGVKVSSYGSVLSNNRLCGNSKDIEALNTDNFGVKNYCDIAVSWTENGGTGCTYDCNNGIRNPQECPECDCEEETTTSSTTTTTVQQQTTTTTQRDTTTTTLRRQTTTTTEKETTTTTLKEDPTGAAPSDEPSNMEECMKKYIEEGNSEQEAYEICIKYFPKDTTTTTTSTTTTTVISVARLPLTNVRVVS